MKQVKNQLNLQLYDLEILNLTKIGIDIFGLSKSKHGFEKMVIQKMIELFYTEKWVEFDKKRKRSNLHLEEMINEGEK